MASIVTTTTGESFILTDEGTLLPIASSVNQESKPAKPAASKPAASKPEVAKDEPKGRKPFQIRDAWKEQAATDPASARMLATCLRYKLVKPAEVAKLTRHDLATRIGVSIAASGK